MFLFTLSPAQSTSKIRHAKFHIDKVARRDPCCVSLCLFLRFEILLEAKKH